VIILQLGVMTQFKLGGIKDMNIEIANRLVNLRKENSLSQEALAAKLGISRQAVSKWERAEASPDTDNLILLAKLYGVSIDSLLQSEDKPVIGEKEEKEEKDESSKAENSESSKREEDIYFNQKDKYGREEYVLVGFNGVHVREKDGSEVHVGWNGVHSRDADGSTVHVSWKGIYTTEAEKSGNVSHDLNEIHDIEEDIYDTMNGDVGENKKNDNCNSSEESNCFAEEQRKLAGAEISKGNVFVSNEGVFINGEEYKSEWFGSWSDNKKSFPFDTLIIITYLITSICFNTWHPGWLIFLVIPLAHSLRLAILKRNACIFSYPVLMLLVFLSLGILNGIWHPSWAVFLTIPVFYSLTPYFQDKWKRKNSAENEKSI